MATLTGNISASQTVIPVSGDAPQTGSFFTVDSESIQFLGTSRGPQGRSFLRDYWSVDRGVAGTTAATHSNGATLTQYYPDAAGGVGGSGVTVDNGTDPPAAVTTLAAAGAVIAGDTATVPTVIVSSDDPGAIGAGRLWLRMGTDSLSTTPLGLFVRSAADDDWFPAAMGNIASDTPSSGANLWNASGSQRVVTLSLTAGGDPLAGSVYMTTASADINGYDLSSFLMSGMYLDLAVYDVTTGDTIAEIKLNENGISFPGLPTSSAGLTAGTLYSNSGVLTLA
jgi:hypothetical protein